ncbi:aldo/keto reductase [Actinomadura sp. B10D3]|uniref:aldo/keto reductase n=1 Tax=Actinomadura sp. B10D3 TaxID=3153557 RepID=UPI00325F41BA
MELRYAPRLPFPVSVLGYGMWGITDWTSDQAENPERALDHAVESGCTFFDTALYYGAGRCEQVLGRLLRRHPGVPLRVATKVPPRDGRFPARAGSDLREVFPTEHILECARTSIRNLGVETIDLLQLHVWTDDWADRDEWRTAVERLKSEGSIRAFGISVNRWEPENVLLAVRTGLVDSVQVIYNIFDQAPEDHLFPACEAAGTAVVVRVPFDEGSLTGRLDRSTRFPDSDWRHGYFTPANLAATMDRIDALRADLGPDADLPRTALRFAISHPAVTTVIPGMRRVGNVERNVAAVAAGPLDPDTLRLLAHHRWDRRPGFLESVAPGGGK